MSAPRPRARLNADHKPLRGGARTLARRGRGSVENIDVGLRRGVSLNEVAGRDGPRPVDIVSVVHAEAATGAASPVAEIAQSRRRGCLMLVDAVAAERSRSRSMPGIDLTALSAQKVGGPAGVCAVAIGDRAWRAISNPAAPRDSALSLLDWDAGSGGPEGDPGDPPPPGDTRTRHCARRVELEGLDATVRRHQR